MSLTPLSYIPGVCKVDTSYSSSNKSGYAGQRDAHGRFTDMNWVRFVGGFPERIREPWAAGNGYNGTARAMLDWRDNNGTVYLAVGTTTQLYYATSATGLFNDITPLRTLTTGTLTNPFTTTNASTTVSTAHTSHGLTTGDWVLLTTSTAIGGITIAGWVWITVVDANNYTFTWTSAATSSVSGGGGTVSYSYPRAILGSNPFSVTSGSAAVTVTHNSHGASPGDMVYWSGGATVGGISLTTGSYIITSTTTNTYTITATQTANATTTGGGSSVSVRYGVSFSNNTTSGTSPAMWTLARYGQQLLACPAGLTIYVYDPSVAPFSNRAHALYNAPSGVTAVFVTPERFVFALGQTGSAMSVSWPDQSDYTNWTPLPTNTANSGRILQEGGFLVGGISVYNGVSLVFSNTAVYVFSYSGDNYVYNSTIAAKGCGLIAPNAVTTMNNVAYWFTGMDFWQWNGVAAPLPSSDIRDYVVRDLAQSFAYSGRGTQLTLPALANCCAGSYIAKQEIWFFYPSNTDSGNENSRYVIYHTDQPGVWSCGLIGFGAWLDKNHFSYAFGGGSGATGAVSTSYTTTNKISQMDFGNGTIWTPLSTNGPTLTFSPMSISNGDRIMEIFSLIPDLKDARNNISNLNIVVNIQNYPSDTISTSPTYNLTDVSGNQTPIIGMRLSGKLLGYKISESGNDSMYSWRLGLPTVDVQPAGARR